MPHVLCACVLCAYVFMWVAFPHIAIHDYKNNNNNNNMLGQSEPGASSATPAPPSSSSTKRTVRGRLLAVDSFQEFATEGDDSRKGESCRCLLFWVEVVLLTQPQRACGLGHCALTARAYVRQLMPPAHTRVSMLLLHLIAWWTLLV